MEEKKTIGLVEDFFKKASYSTGFIYAKANKLKNKTIDIFQNTKVSAADMIESFKNGFESIRGQEAESEKPRPRIKTAIIDTKKEDEFPPESQRIKKSPEELLNADFEKEIEDIDKEVAEV